MIVVSDERITDEYAERILEGIKEWQRGEKHSVLVAGVHVAVEQPDGTWIRVCHDHPVASVVAS